MNEERLSGLEMLLVHRGTDYIPEPEVHLSYETKLAQVTEPYVLSDLGK